MSSFNEELRAVLSAYVQGEIALREGHPHVAHIHVIAMTRLIVASQHLLKVPEMRDFLRGSVAAREEIPPEGLSEEEEELLQKIYARLDAADPRDMDAE